MSEKAASNYLDYLDKEMTIMGILSTFCVAVIALVLDRIGSAEKEGTLFVQLWRHQKQYILLGSLGMALSAVLFYLQRSSLAWYYGQISLSMEKPAINGLTEDWHRDADSWATWIPYHYAFFSMIAAASIYGYALLAAAYGELFSLWVTLSIIFVSAIILTVRMVIYYKYRYEDDPIATFYRKLRGK